MKNACVYFRKSCILFRKFFFRAVLPRAGRRCVRFCKVASSRDAILRPLREAIITVGGLSLEEFDPSTMQCRRLPGLYAAGECLDIDGPTGGYNLEAAFATAALAVRSIASSAKG